MGGLFSEQWRLLDAPRCTVERSTPMARPAIISAQLRRLKVCATYHCTHGGINISG
jgi:hypothetical protein